MKLSIPCFVFTALLAGLFSIASAAPGELVVGIKIADNTNGLGDLNDVDNFGSSITDIGDLDGDGIPDLAVGAASDSTNGLSKGAVYILFLNSNGTVKSQTKIADNTGGFGTLSNGDQFGTSCAAPGDIDGDGVQDLIVGASTDDTGGANRGAAYVLFLNTNGTVKAQTKLAHNTGGFGPLNDNDFFGASCTSLGDLNNDGISEVVIGAKGDDTGGAARGAAYVLFLTNSGTVIGTTKLANASEGAPTFADLDNFGSSCAPLEDLNGDGIPEVIIGAEGDSTGGIARGAVYILFLNLDGSVQSSVKIANGVNGFGTLSDLDLFGSSCTSMGDIDGDGIPDIAVGSKFDSTTGQSRGALHIVFLNQDGTVKSSVEIDDTSPALALNNDDFFGSAVIRLDDGGESGLPFVMVGVPGENTNGSNRGAIFLLALGDLPITVTTTVDELDATSADGTGVSLREAIRDAKATGEFRTILFDSSLNGETIRLSGSGLVLDDMEVHISGVGLPDGITISGENTFRPFLVDNVSSVTFECLTIANGRRENNPGGGLAINSSVARAIIKDTTFLNCTVTTESGGAIANAGTLIVERCTFLNNTAEAGGAIIHEGPTAKMRITNSSFFNNTAVSGVGGAIFNTTTTQTDINFTTFSGNLAASDGSALFVENSIVILQNSLLTDDNIIERDGMAVVVEFNVLTVPDEDLAPLGDFGGKTLTRPLFPTSTAKNAGTFSPLPAFDQNGLARNRNGGTDPGAAEAIETADVQPDNLIGQKPGKQKGNNIFNTNGTGQRINVKLKGKKKAKSVFTVQNDGIIPDNISVRSNKPNRRTLKFKAFQLTGGRANVTGSLIRGRLTLSNLDPGSTVLFRTTFQRKTLDKKARGKLRFNSTSSLFGVRDTVQARVKSLRE